MRQAHQRTCRPGAVDRDYITRSSQRINDIAALLGRLRPACGVFASLGNHDHWDSPSRVAAALRGQHIEVLQNQHTRVSCNGGELVLAGLQSAWGGKPDWSLAAHGVKPGERALALVHEPDFADHLAPDPRIACNFRPHGGQSASRFGALRLPNGGKEYQADSMKSAISLHVNRGIGTIAYHVSSLSAGNRVLRHHEPRCSVGWIVTEGTSRGRPRDRARRQHRG